MAYVKSQGHAHFGPGTSMSLFQKPAWGLSGCPCSGGLGGRCGMGLFDTGLDFSGWGLPEWGIVLVGAYFLFSGLFTGRAAVRRVRAMPGERRRAKAARLRKKAAELTKR